MVDNIQLNAGTGGDALAAKDMGASKHQRVLNETLDATGTPTDVSANAPMPVSGVDLAQLIMILDMIRTGAGGQLPDFQGRTRVNIDAGTLPLVTQVSKIVAFGNLGVDAGMGMYATPQAIRQGIVVS